MGMRNRYGAGGLPGPLPLCACVARTVGSALTLLLVLFASPQTCCRCKARTKCTKKFSIQKFPKILVLRILWAEGWGQGLLWRGEMGYCRLPFVPLAP